jgi:hypothetical protein
MKVKDDIDKCAIAGGIETKSTVVFGADGYDSFLKAIKLANDPKFRISCNFLRSPLFGIPGYLPADLIFVVFGGHFSPIIGYDEDTDLVAVFDVNHKFGMFLVSPKRLYEAVNTYDRSANNTRGLVVTEIIGVRKE